MARLVDALEAAGLAKREVDERDLRAVRICATAKGRKLLLQGRARRVSQLVQLLDDASPAERATLVSAVTTLQRLVKQPASESD